MEGVIILNGVGEKRIFGAVGTGIELCRLNEIFIVTGTGYGLLIRMRSYVLHMLTLPP